jgi:nucleoid-associated protein YgaU
LATKPLGSEEVRWEKYVKSNYTSWTPPQPIPPDKILNPTPYDKGEIVLDSSNAAPEASVAPESVPGQDSTVVEVAPATTAPAIVEDKSVVVAPEAAAPAGKFETYTVVKNDSISKIAKKLKSSTSKIKEANQEILKGSDRIIPGMKLQIPVK